MAVDKNVTWKEYNGTDYDNLYPTTKDSNVLLSAESKEKLGISKDGASVSDAFVDMGRTGAAFAVGDTLTTVRTNLGAKWLLCNGAVVDQTQYPELYDILPQSNWLDSQYWGRANQAISGATRPGGSNVMKFLNGRWVAIGQSLNGKAALIYTNNDAITDDGWNFSLEYLGSSSSQPYTPIDVTYYNGNWVVAMSKSGGGKVIYNSDITADISEWSTLYEFNSGVMNFNVRPSLLDVVGDKLALLADVSHVYIFNGLSSTPTIFTSTNTNIKFKGIRGINDVLFCYRGDGANATNPYGIFRLDMSSSSFVSLKSINTTGDTYAIDVIGDGNNFYIVSYRMTYNTSITTYYSYNYIYMSQDAITWETKFSAEKTSQASNPAPWTLGGARAGYSNGYLIVSEGRIGVSTTDFTSKVNIPAFPSGLNIGALYMMNARMMGTTTGITSGHVTEIYYIASSKLPSISLNKTYTYIKAKT